MALRLQRLHFAMLTLQELLISVERIKAILVSRAQGGPFDQPEYMKLRTQLSNDPRVASKLPRIVKSYRTEAEFWGFIQPKFKSYQERREFLTEQFDGLLEMLETSDANPASQANTDILSTVDSEHVQEAWHKALDRRRNDPDGAVTAARTLLEAVCKHILDECKIAYDDKADLPKLYNLVAKELNLAPNQHVETVVKQILGGCCAVVEGLGALRNRLSDAHGRGKSGAKAQPRHAALAVNLSGSLATFLIETWEHRNA